MLPLLAAAILAAGLISRRLVRARFEQELARRRPVGPDGIIVGAQPILLPRAGAPAVLLLHGGGDTPQTLRYLAEYLADRGYAVSAPLLPGHGRTLADFATARAEDWLSEVRSAYDGLRAEHGWVGVVGLSMGGALAAQLAAEHPELPALVLLAPYLAVPPYVARAAQSSRVWGLVVPFVHSARGVSIRDPDEAAKSLAYGAFAASALRALHATVTRGAEALRRVTAPTLYVQSRDDNRIAPADAQRAFDRLAAPEKQLVWVEGTGHVLTVDYGREALFDLVWDWMERHRRALGREASASA